MCCVVLCVCLCVFEDFEFMNLCDGLGFVDGWGLILCWCLLVV